MSVVYVVEPGTTSVLYLCMLQEENKKILFTQTDQSFRVQVAEERLSSLKNAEL